MDWSISPLADAKLAAAVDAPGRDGTLHIYINGRFLTRRPTGVDRYALEILAELDAMLGRGEAPLAGVTLTVLAPQGARLPATCNHVRLVEVGRRQGVLWEQIDLARALPADGLLLSLCNTGPLWCKNQLVVIHDATTERVPAAYTRGFRLWYRLLLPLLGRRCRRVMTVSQFSRTEIAAVFGLDASRIGVAGNGAEHMQRMLPDPTALQRFGLQRPYMLAVSSMAANKNFKLVLEALAHMPDAPFDVAIAGGSNARVFGEVATAGGERVRWLGYVSDAELRALYDGALGFVFPSLYEGFGIPPLEAMACGCPVLASSAQPMPEVCGDGALYFAPDDPAALAALMLRLAREPALRADLVAHGGARVKLYSWRQSALALLSAARAAVSPATVNSGKSGR